MDSYSNSICRNEYVLRASARPSLNRRCSIAKSKRISFSFPRAHRFSINLNIRRDQNEEYAVHLQVVGTRQIQCGFGPVRDLRTVSSGRWSYGRYQEASRGNVIPTTRKSVLWLAAPRLFASLSFPSSISSLLAPLCSAYHIVGRFRSVAGRLIWQPTRRGDTDRSRQLIKRFPAYCRAATRFCFVA